LAEHDGSLASIDSVFRLIQPSDISGLGAEEGHVLAWDGEAWVPRSIKEFRPSFNQGAESLDKWYYLDHKIAADLYMVEGIQALCMLWASKCFAFPPSNFASNPALTPIASISSNEWFWAVFCASIGLIQLAGLFIMAYRHPRSLHVPMRIVGLSLSSLFFFLIGCGYFSYGSDKVVAAAVMAVGVRGWWSLIRTAVTAGVRPTASR
jgi:hypothetical protein